MDDGVHSFLGRSTAPPLPPGLAYPLRCCAKSGRAPAWPTIGRAKIVRLAALLTALRCIIMLLFIFAIRFRCLSFFLFLFFHYFPLADVSLEATNHSPSCLALCTQDASRKHRHGIESNRTTEAANLTIGGSGRIAQGAIGGCDCRSAGRPQEEDRGDDCRGDRFQPLQPPHGPQEDGHRRELCSHSRFQRDRGRHGWRGQRCRRNADALRHWQAHHVRLRQGRDRQHEQVPPPYVF